MQFNHFNGKIVVEDTSAILGTVAITSTWLLIILCKLNKC